MAEVRKRIESPEGTGQILIPDDSDWGTGTFRMKFQARLLPPVKALAVGMVNMPKFRLLATLNPNLEMPVLIGNATQNDPTHALVFRLPDGLNRTRAYTLVVRFGGWHVLSAELSGHLLSTAQPESVQ